MKRFGYIWVTAVPFLGSLIGHWILGWMVYPARADALLTELEVRYPKK